jgi:hypothetical protein
VIDCRSNVAGSGFDLIQVRNPWGYGGIENGLFAKNGRGWKKHPEIQQELEYVELEEDDGVFWVTKEEFFHHYHAIYLGAVDMKKFLGLLDKNGKPQQVPVVENERESRIKNIPPFVYLSGDDEEDDDDDDDDEDDNARTYAPRGKAVEKDHGRSSPSDGNDASDSPSEEENSKEDSGEESESQISETISLVSEKKVGEPSGIRDIDDDEDDDEESEESPLGNERNKTRGGESDDDENEESEESSLDEQEESDEDERSDEDDDDESDDEPPNDRGNRARR